MGTARALTALLLLALLSADLAVGALPGWPGDWPDPWALLLLSLAFSQISLAATWCGLGSTSLPWRLLGVTAVITAWNLLIRQVLNDDATPYLALALFQTLLIVALLSALRANQWRLVLGTGRTVEARGRSSGRPLQFSLGYLFSWTTSVAVTLGLLRYSLRYEAVWAIARFPSEIAWVALGHAAVALGLVWMVFGTQHLWSRAILLLLATAVALVALDRGTIGPGAANAALCFMQLAWLSLALGVVRVAGYRLSRSECVQHLFGTVNLPERQAPTSGF